MTPDKLRADLADLATSAEHTRAQASKILDAARERHGVVQSRLDELRGKALADDLAGDEYQKLVAERGRLDLVLGGS